MLYICLLATAVFLFAECNNFLPYHLSRKVEHVGIGLLWIHNHEHLPTLFPAAVGLVCYLGLYPYSKVRHGSEPDYGILIYIVVLSSVHIMIKLSLMTAWPWIIMLLSDPSGYVFGKFCPWNVLLIDTVYAKKSLVGCMAVFTCTWVCGVYYVSLRIPHALLTAVLVTLLEVVGGRFDNMMISLVCSILAIMQARGIL